MKKIFKGIIALTLMVSLCGCFLRNTVKVKDSMRVNYLLGSEDGKLYYEIEGKKYFESEEETNYVLIDVLGYGAIVVELNPNEAPITVKNFKKLVGEKFYEHIIFHRVIKNFMIQAGDPTGTGAGGSSETIKGEFKINGVENNISHVRGTISMARLGAKVETSETMNSASSQFFIVQKDSTYLDGNYAGFGKVIAGIDVVDSIANVETNENDKPLDDVIIRSMIYVNVGE